MTFLNRFSSAIVSSPPPGGGVSQFDVALKALAPLRWYALDDWSSGGVMLDSGSQKVNGTYGGSAFNTVGGLVPLRANCIGLTAPSDPGSAFSSTGLPTGASPWTMGIVVSSWVRSFSLGNPLKFNGVDLDWGTSAFEVVTPAGAVQISSSQSFGPMLFAATYDGTTTKVYLYALITSINGGSLIGSASAAQSLNLSTVAGAVSYGNGDYYSQHAFILGTAATSAQLANLASKGYQVQ